MSLPASRRRLIALAALALVGAYNLTQPAHACGLPRPAASSPQESAPKRRAAEALRFDPPAAGPARSLAYEACIDHPSPDGIASDCQALLAKVRRWNLGGHPQDVWPTAGQARPTRVRSGQSGR